jgi:replicative DNA helicase
VAEIIIAKHRNGSVGDVQLAFKASLARFSDIEEISMGSMPDDLGEGKKAVFSSKMNVEYSPSGQDFHSTGFKPSGKGLSEGDVF